MFSGEHDISSKRDKNDARTESREAGFGLVSSIDRYMREVERIPLLSRDDEADLARRYRRTGDLQAAHRLVTSHLRFVVKVAYEYRQYGARLADLIQEGNVGLMTAVKKFDPERGYRLISYAVWWIRAHIHSFLIRTWSVVKMGTTQAQRKLFFKLRRALGLQPGTGRGDEREIARVAKALRVPEADVVEMEMRLSARDFSLDAVVGDDGRATYVDTLASPTPDPEAVLESREEATVASAKVESALATLSQKERAIVERRVMADEPVTLQEIGDEWGVSRERVRQVEARALAKIRGLLVAPKPTPA
ncbi:MAG: RNA polymerase sigma factor RpoH [Deltaproteobacteria bacterium]|nr:RNA polymerase sigma factor RpoH [Deltaproteobacteria bacterium]